MKAGPKGSAVEAPLEWSPRSKGARQFALFCSKYVVTPKGTGARKPMKLRDWQIELAGSLLDDPRPRMALWSLPRGQGKSTLVAALGLFHVFMSGIEGARVVIVAQDERSSSRLLHIAARMVELNEDMGERCQVYKDRIYMPGSDSQILALPGESARIEGEDASLAIMDEIGFCRRDAYESLVNSTGKRAESQMLMIGTPSPPSWRETSPMLDLVLEARANPQPDLALVEYAGDIGHPVDCEHCWAQANPGLDDLVSRPHLKSVLPPRTRESEFRRARLGEWVEQDDASLLPAGLWAELATGEIIPDGADVVLSLDGSFNGDSTALLVTQVSTSPLMNLGGIWEPPAGQDDYRVPILEVEDRIRELAKQYKVIELTADPYRWARTLQVIAEEGIPTTEFPQTAVRMTPATNDFVQSCLNHEVSHDGTPDLARHIGNAILTDDVRGVRIRKENKSSARHIDLAVTAIMGHSRATWKATHKPKRRRAMSF
ncbi:terminase large subunit [Propionimicrobium sp. PCR01-08-3]|uniref:terminase large subunit domain-containing protein n=1 Tax=Propionimicrobium sp. PCR01-08-3 TaxID=3052086 RepID=UPI00255CAEB1|nr:terminase large subunit [Propionimicrobium sp. PCR01-08-3]WIY81776.1 terminase large subunit [Propionimicrobium sp. PCR01-08-3]